MTCPLQVATVVTIVIDLSDAEVKDQLSSNIIHVLFLFIIKQFFGPMTLSKVGKARMRDLHGLLLTCLGI